MRKIILVCVFILFGSILGYAQESVSEETKIILKRGACYGMCPVYTMTIASDGKVAYEGEYLVKAFGGQEKSISQEQFQELLKKLHDVDFALMATQAAELKCQSYVADLPTVEVTLVEAGQTSTILYDGHCFDNDLFKKLQGLANDIDKGVGVKE